MQISLEISSTHENGVKGEYMHDVILCVTFYYTEKELNQVPKLATLHIPELTYSDGSLIPFDEIKNDTTPFCLPKEYVGKVYYIVKQLTITSPLMIAGLQRIITCLKTQFNPEKLLLNIVDTNYIQRKNAASNRCIGTSKTKNYLLHYCPKNKQISYNTRAKILDFDMTVLQLAKKIKLL